MDTYSQNQLFNFIEKTAKTIFSKEFLESDCLFFDYVMNKSRFTVKELEQVSIDDAIFHLSLLLDQPRRAKSYYKSLSIHLRFLFYYRFSALLSLVMKEELNIEKCDDIALFRTLFFYHWQKGISTIPYSSIPDDFFDYFKN